jgi:hypothetical protein
MHLADSVFSTGYKKLEHRVKIAKIKNSIFYNFSEKITFNQTNLGLIKCNK